MIIGIEAQRIFRKKRHGMDMVAVELIKNLMTLDKQNIYYIFVKPGPDKIIESKENFTVVELEGGPYPIWEQYTLPNAAKKYGCDILHCTSNTAPLFCCTPIILTLHDIIYLEHSPLSPQMGGSLYQRFGNLYRRLVVPGAAKKSELVVTVSNFERERIATFMGLGKKLVAIYNGVGEHFRVIEERQQLSNHIVKYSLPDHFFLFLGNTAPKKNTPNLLKGFALFAKKHPLYKLVVIDYSQKDLKEQLALIGESWLLERVVLTGYLPNSELPLTLNLSIAFLYPSLRESFGIPILEAMACGTPVITSNSSSMPEVAGGAALLVDPNSPEEIAGAMERVALEPLLRSELSQKGRERAKEFSWLNMAKGYLALYNNHNNF